VGSALQICKAATGNAWLLMVECYIGGMTRWLIPTEQRHHWPGDAVDMIDAVKFEV